MADRSWGDRLGGLAFRTGFALGPRVPWSVARPLVGAAAWAWTRRGGVHLERWRHNIAVATGAAPSEELVRAGVRSYLRNVVEGFALPAWDGEDLRRLVSCDPEGEATMRAGLAGPGCVLALPHMGNWDLAGAWACSTGAPVSTVAEQLAGPEFATYLAFRERLGMTVHSHRDPGVVGSLVADARAGRLICLVSDRDLMRSGVPVSWRGTPVTMPAGPALVARRSGALFMPIACHYTEQGMHISFGNPIDHRPGRDGLVAMTQHVADFFADQVVAHPADWHLFQPFFDPPATPPESTR